MSSLIAKEGMAEKVQMVYFDPPYGISFKSNFQVSTSSRNVGDSAKDVPPDPAMVSCFRDTYQNGIHSYLDNIRRNAILARELLTPSGSFFLQIGSDNVHRLGVVLDEVFGAENRIATIPFVKSGGTSSKTLPLVADFLLWYAKEKEAIKYFQLYEMLATREEKLSHMSSYAALELESGECRPLTREERKDLSLLPSKSKLYSRMGLASMHESTTGRSEDYVWRGKKYSCPRNSQWRVSKQGMDRLAELNRLDVAENSELLRWKRYEDEVPGARITNLWSKLMSASDLHYIVETGESVVERCLLMTTQPGDLVLDITCGSGTTAYVAEKWGRRWITTDTSGVAVSLTRQRIATGHYKFYLLQDSREGALKEAELSGQKAEIQNKEFNGNVDAGFVYNRVPRVSAGSLAYDQEATPILLVNNPCDLRGTARVSSPFTVESESPYRYVPPEKGAKSMLSATDELRSGIISALEITGLSWKQGSPDEKIRFSEIRDWIQKEKVILKGTDRSHSPITHTAFTDVDGQEARVAIAIAPDDVTVTEAYINRAAESALQIIKEGLLVVIGFAFEAGTRDSSIELRGKLQVIKVQANRDLMIGNLQHNTSDNSFVMIGEPDVDVQPVPGSDLVTVEVLGYDTYNPSTGNIEAGGAGDIDCWMIDSNYDGQSFFARHIHFPKSNDNQIKRLRKFLGRHLDKLSWEAMISHKSVPFKRPTTGRIAVRIVTTTHMEMTRVKEVSPEKPKKQA